MTVDNALVDKLLGLGFSLIPICDKKPLVEWKKYQTEKATKEEVYGWLRRYGGREGFRIGVVTGPVSRLLVLDQDTKAPIGRPLPPTWRVQTTRGYHHYFLWRPEYETLTTTGADVLPSVDVRGKGGYVVFHSPLPGFGVGQPKEAPTWLLSLLGKPTGSRIVEITEGIREGNRNDSLTSLAGSLRGRNYTPDEIFALLRDKAAAIGVSESELRGVCESVGRYVPRSVSADVSPIADFLKDEQKVEWICEGLIPRASIGFVAGLPEAGKTWGLIDLAISCSSTPPLPWLNHFSVAGCRVLFLDQERHKSETQRRFKAVMAARSANATNLFVRCGSTTRLDLEPSYEALKRTLETTKPDVVIVDSWITLLSKSDENDRSSVQLVLERIKEMRSLYGCTFIFVDHEAKGAWQDSSQGIAPSAFRMVGTVAKPAAAEFVFTVRKQDSLTSTYYHTKSTMASTHEPFTVAVRDVDENKEKIAVEVV